MDTAHEIRRRPPYVALMLAWWFGCMIRAGGTFALVAVVVGWLRHLAPATLVVLTMLCGVVAWVAGLGYDAVVSRLLCRDERCGCRTKRGARLVNALECAYGPDFVDPDPESHFPYRRPRWTFRALRWWDAVCVVGFVAMFVHAILTGPGSAFAPR